MPLRVYGLNHRILIDRDGDFYDSGRLYNMLFASTENYKSQLAGVIGRGNGKGIVVDSKDDRIKYRKTGTGAHTHRKQHQPVNSNFDSINATASITNDADDSSSPPPASSPDHSQQQSSADAATISNSHK